LNAGGRNDREGGAFRDKMRGVTPMRNDRAAIERPKPAPVPRPRPAEGAAGEVAATPPPGEGITWFARPGVRDKLLRALRRGRLPVAAVLDLHGLDAAAAERRVARFLHGARGAGRQCVLIVHGKGQRSPRGEPVLKPRLRGWLAADPQVLAVCAAQPEDGGSGAVYVLLRSPGPAR
jgi:DNA-nicking Smr family endonuclease